MLRMKICDMPGIATILLLLPCAVNVSDGEGPADRVSRVVRVHGEVRDPEQKPVTGVRISFVRQKTTDEVIPLSTTTTDDHGKFQLEINRDELDRRHGAPPSLYAIDQSQRFGWRSGYEWTRFFRQEELIESVELEQPITLMEVCDFTGTVVTEQGKPLAGAVVRPVWFSQTGYAQVREKEAANFYVEGLNLSPELQEERAVRTDERGRFELRGVPVQGTIRAVIEAAGYGTPQLMWEPQQELRLQLARSGVIRGRLATEATEKVLDRVRIRVTRQRETDVRPFTLTFWQLVTPAANGSFEIEAPPGDYSLSVFLEEPQDWYAASPMNVEVLAGKESAVEEIPLLRAVAVCGRVVSTQDGVGVEGVRLYIQQEGPDGQHVGAAETDENGYYIGYTRIGKVSLRVTQAPREFLAAEDDARVDVTVDKVDEPVAAPDIKLDPATSIDIEVVDERGSPIPEAEIRTVTPHGAGGLSGNQSFRAEKNGHFKLLGVDPGDTLPIRARSKDGTSDGAVVVEPRDLQYEVPRRCLGVR